MVPWTRVVVKESVVSDTLPVHLRKCANSWQQGLKCVWLHLCTPCRVKSFRKAVSAVMDDLVMMLANKIIDNLHLTMIT